MISINTNLSSLITQRSLTKSTDALNLAIERMTTGFKINHASDNAANYSISTNLTTKISSYMVAEENASMGLDMLNSANGSLDQITDKLERLRALATQASNGTYGTQSLNAINSEASALVDEINRLYTTAEYNGISLFASANGERPIEERFITDFTRRDTSGMTALSSVTDETQNLASGTYSISSVEELEKLARLTNTGKLSTLDPDSGDIIPHGTYEFVLANNIDLAGYGNWTPIGGVIEDTNGDGNIDELDAVGAFTGTFDGNGYAIKNMSIVDVPFDMDTQQGVYIGLFGMAAIATIKNLGVEDVNIQNSGVYTAPLVALGLDNIVDNCYTTGTITCLNNDAYVGGISCWLMSSNSNSMLSNSYSTVTINQTNSSNYLYGIEYIIMDVDNQSVSPVNSFFAGEIVGTLGDGPYLIPTGYWANSAYYVDTWTSEENKLKLESMGYNSSVIGEEKTLEELETEFGVKLSGAGTGTPAGAINFQIGIHSNSSSNITLNLGFALDGVNDLYGIGLDITTDYLTKIDDLLSVVSNKATEYGAVQNRLESALDEIATQYENLVSTRSTIRDADIAEVSSQYIQQQILQQASATLMSTANQTPAIALQLI